MLKFSIIIPVYNAEKYISKCIESTIKQQNEDFEVIIVDDGSEDESGVICDEFSQKDSRIKVIHKKNGGVSEARNVGIKNAKGMYIMFLDSDDTLNENALIRLNDIINSYKDIQCILFNINTKLQSKIYKTEELENLISYLIINEEINPPWNKVYKRSIIEKGKIKFDKNIQIGEDLLFSIEYLSHLKRIYVLSERLYNYTINNNSLTRRYKKNKYQQLMYVNNKLKKYLKAFKSEKILECGRYVRLKNIFSCFMDLSHTDCRLTKRQKKEYIKDIRKQNRIVIKKLGIKIYLLSIIYLILPANLILYISKILSEEKLKRIKKETKN